MVKGLAKGMRRVRRWIAQRLERVFSPPERPRARVKGHFPARGFISCSQMSNQIIDQFLTTPAPEINLPLVCPGYLPLEVLAELTLRDTCRQLGLPAEIIRQAAEQIGHYREN